MSCLTLPIRSAAVAATAVLLASPALAQPAPDANIDLTGRSVAVGVGYTWGGGTLHYRGKDYPLKIKGVSVIDVGISKFSARGGVYKLRQVTDIEGVYHALEVGATVAAGAGAATMGNDKGVQIRLSTSSAGLHFKLAPEGVIIDLQ
jgi:hypothetical protein